MSQGPVNTIRVGDKTYHLARASAVKQKSLLTIVGKNATARSAMVAAQSAKLDGDEPENIGVGFVKGMLLSMDEATLDKVDQIVLYKCFDDENNQISINNFQDSMNAYITLLAEGVLANLADFFTWLDSEAAKVYGANRPVKKKETSTGT